VLNGTLQIGVAAFDQHSIVDNGVGSWAASLQPVTMVGATGVLAGTKGYVPTPLAGDDIKFLRGDGAWAFPNTTPPTAFKLPEPQSAGMFGLMAAVGLNVYRSGRVASSQVSDTYSVEHTPGVFQIFIPSCKHFIIFFFLRDHFLTRVQIMAANTQEHRV
jgi:hypothetical protein